jgi:uncharacterized protein (TIGR00255 family)
MKSMTGFGRGSLAVDDFAVSVELKTVNNRFLDVNLRLPSELQSLETSIKRQISNRLSRGRVDVNLSLERTAKITYELNRPLISGYLTALREMQTEFNLAGEPDLNVIAKLPGVLQAAREDLDASAQIIVEKAIEQALDELEEMRLREGESLQKELFLRLSEIERQVAIVEPETANVTENYRLKLHKKIADLLQKTETQIELDQARIAQEAAYLAERSDISEELTRLKSHVGQFREISASENDTGKRLDFLVQELNREANTILSKSTDLKIKDAALSVKAEIEKLREQIQNIE